MGHIMTIMTTTAVLPDPNNEESLQQHQQHVFGVCSQVFAAIDTALTHAVPTALNTLSLLNGPRDRAVHATLTRYIVRTKLAGEGLTAEDEPPPAELEWVANCGICIHVQGFEIRVLKSSDGEIPKAGSDARSRFYCSNQLSLFAEQLALPVSNLKLVALWDIDTEYGYAGLEIACPRGEMEDRTVDCFWKSRWSQAVSADQDAESATSEDGDLDIQPMDSVDQGRQTTK